MAIAIQINISFSGHDQKLWIKKAFPGVSFWNKTYVHIFSFNTTTRAFQKTPSQKFSYQHGLSRILPQYFSFHETCNEAIFLFWALAAALHSLWSFFDPFEVLPQNYFGFYIVHLTVNHSVLVMQQYVPLY